MWFLLEVSRSVFIIIPLLADLCANYTEGPFKHNILNSNSMSGSANNNNGNNAPTNHGMDISSMLNTDYPGEATGHYDTSSVRKLGQSIHSACLALAENDPSEKKSVSLGTLGIHPGSKEHNMLLLAFPNNTRAGAMLRSSTSNSFIIFNVEHINSPISIGNSRIDILKANNG